MSQDSIAVREASAVSAGFTFFNGQATGDNGQETMSSTDVYPIISATPSCLSKSPAKNRRKILQIFFENRQILHRIEGFR